MFGPAQPPACSDDVSKAGSQEVGGLVHTMQAFNLQTEKKEESGLAQITQGFNFKWGDEKEESAPTMQAFNWRANSEVVPPPTFNWGVDKVEEAKVPTVQAFNWGSKESDGEEQE